MNKNDCNRAMDTFCDAADAFFELLIIVCTVIIGIRFFSMDLDKLSVSAGVIVIVYVLYLLVKFLFKTLSKKYYLTVEHRERFGYYEEHFRVISFLGLKYKRKVEDGFS